MYLMDTRSGCRCLSDDSGTLPCGCQLASTTEHVVMFAPDGGCLGANGCIHIWLFTSSLQSLFCQLFLSSSRKLAIYGNLASFGVTQTIHPITLFGRAIRCVSVRLFPRHYRRHRACVASGIAVLMMLVSCARCCDGGDTAKFRFAISTQIFGV